MYFIVIYLTAYFNWWLRKTKERLFLWCFGLFLALISTSAVTNLVGNFVDNAVVSEGLHYFKGFAFYVCFIPWICALFLNLKGWADKREQLKMNLKKDGTRAIYVNKLIKLIKLGKKR